MLGGKSRLREYLRVSMRDLERWMEGAENPPTPIFLKVVDVISIDHRARTALPPSRDGKVIVETALDDAIAATGAEMGNVQLALPEGLRIVVHRGFGRPFLDFYAVVDDRSPASCGVAKKARKRVVVPDVASDPIFAGTPAEEVMAAANVRSVQSTPLFGPAGKLYGMLNTHWASPRDLTRADEEALDRIAERTVFWLEAGAA